MNKKFSIEFYKKQRNKWEKRIYIMKWYNPYDFKHNYIVLQIFNYRLVIRYHKEYEC
jgi:hypothetical protein